VGAEPVDSWRDVSWDCSWPSSNCRELIKESFSESEDLRDAISFSFEAMEVEYVAFILFLLLVSFQRGPKYFLGFKRR